MAFDRSQPRQPDDIGTIEIHLRITPAVDGSMMYDARFNVDVVDAGGEVVDQKRGELTQHLTPAQQSNVKGFLDDMRAKAVAEILPAG